MARVPMQRALSPAWLDGLFEQHRQRQYTRERLFSTAVDLMALVALGLRPRNGRRPCPQGATCSLHLERGGSQQFRREPCRPQGVTRPPISGKRS